MNSPFFNDPTRLGVLVRAAHGWLGTPFHANSETAGTRGGVCCHLLVWHLYRAAGVEIARPPLGPTGHARFNRVSLMEPWLDACPQFVRAAVFAGELQPGDLLGYNVGGSIHHLAVLLPGGQLVHALQGVGATFTPAADPTWSIRHAATWRPIEITS